MAAQRVGDELLPIDWGAVSPLRLQAQIVAEGIFTGTHRSRRRGPGVEFGGQRPYVAGDDLRFLDLHSLLRHDRLMVRQFETDTERAMWLCVDASASMAYRGPEGLGAKLAYAALIAAALTRVAVAGQDGVGLAWLGGKALDGVAVSHGQVAFERIVSRLEQAQAWGDLSDDPKALDSCVRLLAQRARRGSILVWLSDLLDMREEDIRTVVSLGSGARALVLVQVLDPRERDLSFRGTVRLRAIEGKSQVATDADAVRNAYLERLDALTESWRRGVESVGGRLVRACTNDDPVQVVRDVLRAVGEARG